MTVAATALALGVGAWWYAGAVARTAALARPGAEHALPDGLLPSPAGRAADGWRLFRLIDDLLEW